MLVAEVEDAEVKEGEEDEEDGFKNLGSMRSIPKFAAPKPKAIIKRRRLIDFEVGCIRSSSLSFSGTAVYASSHWEVVGVTPP